MNVPKCLIIDLANYFIHYLQNLGYILFPLATSVLCTAPRSDWLRNEKG